MSRTLQELTDQLLEGSATREEYTLRGAAQAPREAPARTPATRTHPARLAAREVQALRPTGLPLRQQSRPRPQTLSVDQHARAAPADRLRAERCLHESDRVPRQLPQRAR